MRTNSSTPLAALATLAFGLLLGGATWIVHDDVRAQRDLFAPDQDVVYLPRTSALHAASLGHDELLADLVFLRTLNYFAAELGGAKDYAWLDRHVDTIIGLDPHFRAPYVFGSRATMYNGLPITNEMVLRSNHFLEAGLAQFPGDWELAFALGCNYLNELQTTDKAQKDAWRRKGGQWIRHAAISGGGPTWLPNLAATIMTEEGEHEAAIRYLEEAYLTAEDETSKMQIQNLLGAKRRSDMGKLMRAREEFTQSWKSTLPYAPGDLFAIVGAPRPPRLDLPTLTRDPVLEAAIAPQ